MYSLRIKAFALFALACAIPCLVAAERPSREPVYSGEPIDIYVKAGHTVYLSVPYDIMEFTPPVTPGEAEIRIPMNFPRNLTIRAIEPKPEPVTFTIPTNADKGYVIRLVPGDKSDSWVTILDPPEKAAAQKLPEATTYERKNLERIQEASTSPLDDALAAMLYTMWGQDPRRAIYNVSMEATDIVMVDSPREMVRAIWSYEGEQGFYGWTLHVTNRALEPMVLDVRRILDARGARAADIEGHGNLAYLSLDHLGPMHRRSGESTIEPGASALLHLTYLEPEYEQ